MERIVPLKVSRLRSVMIMVKKITKTMAMTSDFDDEQHVAVEKGAQKSHDSKKMEGPDPMEEGPEDRSDQLTTSRCRETFTDGLRQVQSRAGARVRVCDGSRKT
jgi:hypothetical protein